MPKIELMSSLMAFGALVVGPTSYARMSGALLAGRPIVKG
jgi:hypothetical protein